MKPRIVLAALVSLLALPAPARAQGAAVDWQAGPMRGALGRVAEIDVPSGFVFVDAANARRLLEVNQNLVSGDELGAVAPEGDGPEDSWVVFFEFDESGYVSDEERGELDAQELLDTLRDGNAAGNEERERRGWDRLELVGWAKEPFYDPKTNNLTWATRLRSSSGETINWSTRLLGRRGTMNVDLVIQPDQLQSALPRFEELLAGFAYVEGQRYAEFRAGDKVAEYGLTALIAGGAGALGAKTGLFGKLWKGIVAAGVALAALAKKLFGRGRAAPTEA
jgi:uncharacterized membrane-anchored protein